VGSREESLNIRGFRYHPVDLEMTVVRCHRNVSECAVFTWTRLLVVVAEVKTAESEALDLIPLITTALLEEQQVIAGIVVLVDPGSIPINAKGEKQRMHLRDSFLNDELDPIYVAYNL
jgi:acyl-CoA synthetase (AMP-forming)/AMP-acid ligase II